jgi:hypothetical protein
VSFVVAIGLILRRVVRRWVKTAPETDSGARGGSERGAGGRPVEGGRLGSSEFELPVELVDVALVAEFTEGLGGPSGVGGRERGLLARERPKDAPAELPGDMAWATVDQNDGRVDTGACCPSPAMSGAILICSAMYVKLDMSSCYMPGDDQ